MSTSGTAVAKTDASTSAATPQSKDATTWQQLTRGLLEPFDLTKISIPTMYPAGSAVVTVDPKAAEVFRQVERLRIAREFAESRGEPFDSDDLVASIQILQNLTVGSLPIPIASWDPESGPSLFFSEDGFYGDVEINGKKIEYLLRFNDQHGVKEVYDSEDIEEGRLPPRLLLYLFHNFARSNANVP